METSDVKFFGIDELPELSLTRNTVNQVKLMFELHGSEKETVFD